MWIWDINSLGDILRDLIFTKKTPSQTGKQLYQPPTSKMPPTKIPQQEVWGFLPEVLQYVKGKIIICRMLFRCAL